MGRMQPKERVCETYQKWTKKKTSNFISANVDCVFTDAASTLLTHIHVQNVH